MHQCIPQRQPMGSSTASETSLVKRKGPNVEEIKNTWSSDPPCVKSSQNKIKQRDETTPEFVEARGCVIEYDIVSCTTQQILHTALVSSGEYRSMSMFILETWVYPEHGARALSKPRVHACWVGTMSVHCRSFPNGHD